jgi:hypothetical protein
VSWRQLLSIFADAQTQVQQGKRRERLACPNDGEPFSRDQNGSLYCKFDGYQPDSDTYIGGED